MDRISSKMISKSRIIYWYLRLSFVILIVLPACALVIWRYNVALTDPIKPQIATQNMALAVMYAYGLVCTRASMLPQRYEQSSYVLIGFGAFYLMMTGALICLYALIRDRLFAGFLALGLYYLSVGLFLLLVRWPNLIKAASYWARSVKHGFEELPERIRNPSAPKVPAYWALFCAVLLSGLIGLLQPGIGLAFRWYPYEDPTMLTPTESLITGFFVPAVFFLYAYWHCLYDVECILFTEYFGLAALFHGFAMMCDSIAGTQGNDNVHHILGGDVVLMWLIGFIFLGWHPSLSKLDLGVKVSDSPLLISTDRGASFGNQAHERIGIVSHSSSD